MTHYVVYAQGKVHLVKKSLSCTQDEVIGELARLCRVPPVSIIDYIPLSGEQMRMPEMELRRIYGGF